MDPVTVIVSALAVGAATGLNATASAAVKDAYAALKNLLTRRYGVDVTPVEKKPDSKAKRESLAEDLAAAGLDADEEIMAAARKLLAQVRAAGPAPALGIDIEKVEAAALRVHNVVAEGTGVRVRDSKFAGDIEISDVQAGPRQNP